MRDFLSPLFASFKGNGMTPGSVQKIVICTPVTDGSITVSVGACASIPRSSGIYRAQVVDAFVLDPASASVFDPVDSADAAAVFSVGFSTVLFCYLLGRGIGSVLAMIRQG